MSHADELGLTPEEAAEHYEKMQGGAHVQEKQSPYTTDKAGAGYIMANKDKIIQQLYAGGVQSVLDPKEAVKAISDLIPDVTEKEIIDIKEIIFTFEYPKTFNVSNSLLFLIEIKNHIAETNIIKGIKFIKIKFGI